MIQAPQLLADLTRQLKRLEDDLRLRVFDPATDVPALKPTLQAEWQAARDADRTAETFETWAEQVLTQAGVHWLLSCVFIRFIEDNGLVERPWLGGTPESGRLALARDRHEAYFRQRPTESDRDYLLAAFREAGALPGLATFFDAAHNPVFRLPISGDAAMALRQFWQQVDPNTGTLVHDFTDPAWNTRFLGDLYQDLSEATRKRYALLQTPEFVEEFILDRTLTPAIREFGLREVRMIDPTCGSGHFLLGGFHRLVDEWARAEPGRNRRDIAQKALDAVAGVDLNPFAVAIARFRLLLAALKVAEVQRLADAPNFRLNVAIGDSLLHGRRFGLTATEGMFEGAEHYAGTGLAHAYASEDLDEVNRILGRQYHAVVGNPPYIVVKDAALNAAYRQRYASCHMKYSLGAPFTERFFELALTGNGRPAGFVGLITANSFMKREFGSKLIEQVLPRLDLTHVVDTSGAYIPGHGTPTVILFGRHRAPVGDAVRTVMGIKGEPSTPDDPAQGLVWSAIVGQVDRAGSESEFVSVADTPRATFAKHPWSIGGGGAADLKERVEDGRGTLGSVADSIGFASFTGADEVFSASAAALRRAGFPANTIRPFVVGDAVRDYVVGGDDYAFAPYTESLDPIPLAADSRWGRAMWPYRSSLEGVLSFAGKTRKECGDLWWTWYRWVPTKYRQPLSITFAEVATHNHFVLDCGGKVFNRTAPVIKLPAGASEDEHLGLLGLLNSSVACFWFQQVCHNKGGPGGGSSKDEKWHDFYAFNSTKVAEFPLVAERPVALARRLDALAMRLGACMPAAQMSAASAAGTTLTRGALNLARTEAASIRRQMVAWQEELDWHAYGLYGVLPTGIDPASVTHADPPEVERGERAFEIVLARRVAAGTLETRWFEWLGVAPVTEIPVRWPADYREVVQRRIDLIERDRNVGLVESMGCKRRWEWPVWDELERTALRDWLLDRLEAPHLWPAGDDHPPQLTTVNRLADAVRGDAGFMQIAELYAGHSGFDVAQVVAELVAGESVPFLPVLRYTDTGLRKRAQWEATWALQRREDAGENVGKIPVPPKYQSKDFLKADFWRLRGGLDVPKERWVSYPGCERGADGSLVIAWAGWNHLQQATALAAYYLDMKDNEGWPRERLQPLLAGLLELVPWLKQWHNEVDPTFGERMGDYYEGFLNDQARELGFTRDDLRAWKPAPQTARRGRPRKAAV
ncbi:BREX-2 system adenine-specific DNA-methyltransferase PglX [Calidifontimicrobium sp. SYSU G02091]|uniref:BREX-2 system adenine-specific DNA-methyltransferase PglX n=1 Tax=Calidifontimicrobium sp. SYSU G02091 TaxID=2926421 RepID=UPI001F53DD79|nr:BREX-2 system adenine-specific DNA-methyltransferase PglX [Calidifontimicrobium sp. SYSU G02091]MCI1192607.1 BREX-2 system adenine-specific DNA-methyltransferase PglX [Calidifontimicrobium sp. SYSU G02091]